MTTTSALPRLTLPEAARLTELAMTACNLSGLSHDFPRVMEAVWDDVRSRGEGTDAANHHPLAVLWLVKMAELARLVVDDAGSDAIHQAFAWLREHTTEPAA